MTDPLKPSDPLYISNRSGLPDDLKLLLKDYPRTEWQRHRNLGSMAQFWLRRHAMFRDLGRMLNQGLAKYREGQMEPGKFTEWFFPRLNFFLQNLNGHHQIEDFHYFPVFREAERRLARGFDLLDSDHHVLHEGLERNAAKANLLIAAIQAGRDEGLSAADGFATDTESLVAMMLRHLDDEEDLIIPVILDRGEEELGVE